jgi:hypothetical protein
MSYLRRLNPRGGVEDFLSYWREPTPYRWQILGASVALTFVIMVLFIPESQRAEPRRPHVTYISTFEPGRTDAEIAASNLENQRLQDQRRADAAERAEKRKAAYRALGRATGIDVDAMERRIEQEQAAEEAAAARTRARTATPPPAASER